MVEQHLLANHLALSLVYPLRRLQTQQLGEPLLGLEVSLALVNALQLTCCRLAAQPGEHRRRGQSKHFAQHSIARQPAPHIASPTLLILPAPVQPI